MRNPVVKISVIMTSIITLVIQDVLAQNSRYNGFKIDEPLIPKDEIHHGGPPKDGIPAINQPKFITAEEAGFLGKDDRILGVTLNGKSKHTP